MGGRTCHREASVTGGGQYNVMLLQRLGGFPPGLARTPSDSALCNSCSVRGERCTAPGTVRNVGDVHPLAGLTITHSQGNILRSQAHQTHIARSNMTGRT